MSDRATVTVDWKWRDLLYFHLMHMPRPGKSGLPVLLLFINASALLAIFFFNGIPQSNMEWLGALLSLIIMNLFLALLYFFIMFYKILLMPFTSKGIFGRHDFEINKQGLREETASNKDFISWNGIKDITISGPFLSFSLANHTIQVLTARSFSSRRAFQQFFEMSVKLWKANQNHSLQIETNDGIYQISSRTSRFDKLVYNFVSAPIILSKIAFWTLSLIALFAFALYLTNVIPEIIEWSAFFEKALICTMFGLISGAIFYLIFALYAFVFSPDDDPVHHYEVTEEGLRLSTNYRVSLQKWHGIVLLKERGPFLRAMAADHVGFIIPKSSFTSAQAYRAFVQQAQQYWSSNKD
jgi:hypothetical protein